MQEVRFDKLLQNTRPLNLGIVILLVDYEVKRHAVIVHQPYHPNTVTAKSPKKNNEPKIRMILRKLLGRWPTCSRL